VWGLIKASCPTDYWLQRWIAIGEKHRHMQTQLLEDYYMNEFLAVLDAYNEMHKVEKEPAAVEVGAEAWNF
jgi:DNA-binding SARP family transcriptional activator